MPSELDAPAIVVAWVGAALGIAITVVASSACHSGQSEAAAALTIAVIVAVQLLHVAVTCFVFRHWIASETDTDASRGPAPHQVTFRSGFPAWKSSKGTCGLDRWSGIGIALLVLHIAVPAISLHRPSPRFEMARSSIRPKKPTITPQNYYYTSGASEAIRLSSEAQIVDANVAMSNTADVAHLPDQKMIALLYRVPYQCNSEKVQVQRLPALFAKYSCSYPPSNVKVDDVDDVRLNISSFGFNTTKSPPAGFFHVIRAQFYEFALTCNATYFSGTLDASWTGRDRGPDRRCRIDAVSKVSALVPWANLYLYSLNMSELTLSMSNAYAQVVPAETPAAIYRTNNGDVFFGSIWAAATIIRSIFRNSKVADIEGAESEPVTVHYATDVCYKYGWSWLVIFLIIADVLLAVAATVLSSGVVWDQVKYVMGEVTTSVRKSSPNKKEQQSAEENAQSHQSPHTAVHVGGGGGGQVFSNMAVQQHQTMVQQQQQQQQQQQPSPHLQPMGNGLGLNYPGTAPMRR